MPAKYTDYADIFSFDLVIKLLENKKIGKYTIKMVKGN